MNVSKEKELEYAVFEEFGKKRIKALLEGGDKPLIIAGFTDFFGDAKMEHCAECGVPVIVRPWLKEIIDQHHLPVICICCVDSQVLTGQLTMDLAKIQSEVETSVTKKRIVVDET